MNYHNEIDAVLRYSGGDTQDVRDFLHTLSQPEHADTLLGRGQHDVRMIAADAFEEAGRAREADHLRTPDRPLVIRHGKVIEKLAPHNLDPFTRSYAESALWSSHHYGVDDEDNEFDEPMDENHDLSDIHDKTLADMAADCRDFRESLPDHLQELIDRFPEQAGHDFWLTRNRHGAGYWDGDWGEHGRELTDHARPYGEVDLYVGDDGKIHGQ